MTMLSSRNQQRVYFANTPWWVPLGLVALALVGFLGAAAYGYWRDVTTVDPARTLLDDHVERFRDGDLDALSDLEEVAHVTVDDGRTVYALTGERTGTCWAVHVDVGAGETADADTTVAGPLPASDATCAA